jgi:excisionase family DNA binding protein
LDVHAVLRQRRTAWRVPELARLLSLGPRTVYDAIDSGQLPAIKIGTALRISPADAVKWVEAGTYRTKGKTE